MLTFNFNKVKLDNKSGIMLDLGCGEGRHIFGAMQQFPDLQCVGLDPHLESLDKSQEGLELFESLSNNTTTFLSGSAYSLPFADSTFDLVVCSEVLEHLHEYRDAITEINRVLKPGGRYLCLEFSKIQNPSLNYFYKNYSKLIPLIGKLFVGEKEPYEYLIKSIENFINQEELVNLMSRNKFKKCSFRNLSGGIVSIHSGWKF